MCISKKASCNSLHLHSLVIIKKSQTIFVNAGLQNRVFFLENLTSTIMYTNVCPNLSLKKYVSLEMSMFDLEHSELTT